MAVALLAVLVLPIRWNPLTARKLDRFRRIKRGYWSFLLLAIATVGSMFAELFISDRALVVWHEGQLHFPTYGKVRLGAEFGAEGVDRFSPADYRALDARWEAEGADSWALLPLVPYNPREQNPYEGVFKPRPPSPDVQHYLGTDSQGRDILARLVYGFRIAIFFALAFMVLTYLIGIAFGCLMGYFGGATDLLGQRLIEIWSNVPFLYMVIIIFSVIPSGFSVEARIAILLLVMVLFSWTGMTYYMRTATYKEKARDYTAAARVLGAGSGRIIFRHILPNTVSTIVTFMPFTIVSAITAITALDFLGFGLPVPTPSLGELLKQGTSQLRVAPWIVSAAFSTLVILLTLVTFVGEAIREAFDPKKFTVYK
ncbi:MAG: ABC transporter permease [Verrucomicrobiota bacterium]